MDHPSVLLSISYIGPVQYFTKFLFYDEVHLEIHENYTRQTYRNRCNIYGANGKLALTVPVMTGEREKTPIKDLRIDYTKKWQKLHWKGIESAYRSSPFYEFYIDDFIPFYSKKYTFLFDLNTEILKKILLILDINTEIKYTDRFNIPGTANITDMRDSIHPKKSFKSDRFFSPFEYNQVFSGKHGFIANLSVIDLIFNEGPEAGEILRSSINSWSF